ncbi:hypothetical protein BB561_006587 [Smittium simulii]|uniref:Uncharacterized protein n=1 Tax=Smittium simulii TaxID=133385 RepID=A0A2T9Y2Z9_9FUNG|nr:hypothetical protein BB561_006587 [Smittium simulii]
MQPSKVPSKKRDAVPKTKKPPRKKVIANTNPPRINMPDIIGANQIKNTILFPNLTKAGLEAAGELSDQSSVFEFIKIYQKVYNELMKNQHAPIPEAYPNNSGMAIDPCRLLNPNPQIPGVFSSQNGAYSAIETTGATQNNLSFNNGHNAVKNAKKRKGPSIKAAQSSKIKISKGARKQTSKNTTVDILSSGNLTNTTNLYVSSDIHRMAPNTELQTTQDSIRMLNNQVSGHGHGDIPGTFLTSSQYPISTPITNDPDLNKEKALITSTEFINQQNNTNLIWNSQYTNFNLPETNVLAQGIGNNLYNNASINAPARLKQIQPRGNFASTYEMLGVANLKNSNNSNEHNENQYSNNEGQLNISIAKLAAGIQPFLPQQEPKKDLLQQLPNQLNPQKTKLYPKKRLKVWIGNPFNMSTSHIKE